MKVAVIFANGTEEIEALTPVDVLRRASISCDIVSVSGEAPVGSHGITVKADKTVEETDFSIYDAIVIPGGMPGATNIAKTKKIIEAIGKFIKVKKLIAAICASPAVVLAEQGFLGENKATCYPADVFIKALGSNYTGENVEVSENIITANGPKSAMEFSLAICNYLGVNPKF